MKRRNFLKALGLGASAPLLMPLFRNVIAMDGGAIPRRFVIVVEGNGIEPVNFLSQPTRAAIDAASTKSIGDRRFNFPQVYGHESALVTEDAALHGAPVLSSLKGQGAQLDLSERAAVVFGISSKVAGGGHSSGYGALSSASSRGSSPGGPTIDAALARFSTVHTTQPFDVVRLGVTPDLNKRLLYGTCALDAGRPAPIVTSPTAAFNMLFGSVASANGQRAFSNRRELLDYSHKDVTRALGAFAGSSRERAKLERYIESIENLQRRQTLLEELAPTLTQVKPADPEQQPMYESPHPLERLTMQFELARAALIGGLTNVVVLTSGTKDFGLTYSSLADVFAQDPNSRGPVDRHSVCHESGGNPVFREVLRRVTQRHVELSTELARALAAVPEGDGTMLDHTMIVYMSDNGDQHHSPGEDWPMLLMGGEKLGLKTGGQSVVYPGLSKQNHRQMSNFFNTMGYAAGQALDTFGGEGSTRISEGPLSELLS